MDKKILVVYKSVTGFTRDYGEMIVEEMKCDLLELKKATAEIMSDYDTVIFGGRMHVGRVDGLERAKALFQKSHASRFIVYAVGAMPNMAQDAIEEMWNNNLTPEEVKAIPHFYFPGGLRYERMPLFDAVMMKMLSAVLKKSKDQEGDERKAAEVMGNSYDNSSKTYILPLIAYLRAEGT